MDALSDAAAAGREETVALLLLQRTPGVREAGLKRLWEEFGSARAALDAPEAAFPAVLGDPGPRRRRIPLEVRRRWRDDRAAVVAALDLAAARGIRVLAMGAAGYPERLLQLEDPPAVLFARGRTELLDRPAVAIVGARRATPYGRRATAWLGGALARAGAVVVSGLALGIDAEAHQAALEAGGATVAVLGTGADVVHPRTNTRLHRAIARDGLLVSELPPGTPALAHHFPKRNRIMAALAHAVVVVEAARGSGSLITVRHAMDLGREVFAVPGPIDAPASVETNAMIADGAGAALGPQPILEAIGLGARMAAATEPPDGTDGATLWRVLAGQPVELDELADRAGLSPRRALTALSLLELEGWAVQAPGGRYARRL